MPIYEYTCSGCGHPFETLVLNQREVVACPKCGSERVAKRFSVFGVGAGASSGAGAGEMSDSGGCPPTGCARPDCGAFN